MSTVGFEQSDGLGRGLFFLGGPQPARVRNGLGLDNGRAGVRLRGPVAAWMFQAGCGENEPAIARVP
ncbi:MAG TPA: hypothetical protein VFA18_23410, partial [Gemmataceae bacterium]|nr:hypothetical protein [Gemmataceae bacterium]